MQPKGDNEVKQLAYRKILINVSLLTTSVSLTFFLSFKVLIISFFYYRSLGTNFSLPIRQKDSCLVKWKWLGFFITMFPEDILHKALPGEAVTPQTKIK
jgi:hypothetical protein